MIPKKEINFFIRYLKDNGLLEAFKRDAELSAKHGKTPFKEFINKEYTGATPFVLMDCVLWSVTSYKFWHNIFDNYNNFFTNYFHEYKK